MEMVKMVASAAGDEVFVGECHPARARILVKKELASWKDGKILLHILGVHDTLLASNPSALRGPLDDANVSKQEMERRLAWFRSFLTKSSAVLAKMARPLPSLEEACAWVEAERAKEEARSEDPDAEKLGTIPSFRLGRRGTTLLFHHNRDIVLADAEVEAYFENECVDALMSGSTELEPVRRAADEFLAEQGLSALWESAPDVSRAFLVPGVLTGPGTTKEAYEKLRERDRLFFRQAYGRQDHVTSPSIVVAQLDQVRYLWSHNEY